MWLGSDFMTRYLAAAMAVSLLLTGCAGESASEAQTATSTAEVATSTEASTTSTTSTTTTTTVPTTTTTLPPTTTTEPKPELTQEVAAASLDEVTQKLFTAWLNVADDEYPVIDQEIETIVRDVLAAHSPISEVPGWQEEYLRRGRDGVEQFSFGDEWFPEGTFTSLAVIGVPSAPVTLYSGVYSIGDEWTGSTGGQSGDETTLPGMYRVLDVEDCYWERLDGAGEIIDNNFINAAPRVEATIRSSDFAFNSEGCGRWVRIDG